MGFSCLECLRRFSQAMLIITNSVIALLGLAVLIVGIWAQVSHQDYFTIVDNASQFNSVGILLIVAGLFVLIVGVIGVIGAVFATTVFGRITLGLYGVVLALLILCEIAGGIAAGVKRNDLNSLFRTSAQLTFNQTLLDESKENAWNFVQSTFECCGVDSYKDYIWLYPNGTVPSSCCFRNVSSSKECGQYRFNATLSGIIEGVISDKGCVPLLVNGVDTYLGAIAAVGILFGLFQIFGVVMACFVAIYRERENKYEVV